MKRLRDIIRPGFLVSVQRDASVADAVRAMADHNVGIVAVLDENRLVGVFSERDVVRRVVGRGLDPSATPVEGLMTTDLIVADADEDAQSAMSKRDQANIRHLPVVKDGQLLSMVSIRDLMRVELHAKTEELHYLHEYLYQVSPGVTVPR
jgi:CBS domain-containing protein